MLFLFWQCDIRDAETNSGVAQAGSKVASQANDLICREMIGSMVRQTSRQFFQAGRIDHKV